jgi:DnaK suppressor protein
MGAQKDAEEKPLDLKAIKKRLLEDQAQLERNLAMRDEDAVDSGDDLVQERGGVGNHMADDATDTTEEETTLALQNEAQQMLDQINEALERIEAGTYGVCANCGKKIPQARLEARPFAKYDIKCQELADQGKI